MKSGLGQDSVAGLLARSWEASPRLLILLRPILNALAPGAGPRWST